MQSIIRKLLFALVVLALAGSAAHAEGSDHRCSVNKLRGQYGFKIDGGAVTPVSGRFAAVGTQTFDGAGNFSTTNYISVDGRISLFSFSGTYIVNSDCTGVMTAHFPGGVTSSNYFVLAKNENTLYTISLDPGSVITGVFAKVVESHSDEER